MPTHGGLPGWEVVAVALYLDRAHLFPVSLLPLEIRVWLVLPFIHVLRHFPVCEGHCHSRSFYPDLHVFLQIFLVSTVEPLTMACVLNPAGTETGQSNASPPVEITLLTKKKKRTCLDLKDLLVKVHGRRIKHRSVPKLPDHHVFLLVPPKGADWLNSAPACVLLRERLKAFSCRLRALVPLLECVFIISSMFFCILPSASQQTACVAAPPCSC